MKEIITPCEVAAILRIHVQTVYRLAEKGTIPGNKIGRSWRFSKKDVLDLVTDEHRKRSKGGDQGHKKQSPNGLLKEEEDRRQ